MRRRLYVSQAEYHLLTPEDFEKWEILIDLTRGGKFSDCLSSHDYQQDYDEQRQEDWTRR